MVNLHQLTGLTSVGGNLDFFFNERLQTLEGISNLTTVGGSLRIIGNANVTSVDPMQGLRFVGGGMPTCYATSRLTSPAASRFDPLPAQWT